MIAVLNIRPFRRVNLTHLFTVITLLFGTCSFSQTVKNVSSQVNPATLPPKSSIKFVAGGNKDLFGIRFRFKENVGQYGDTINGYGYMGHVLYGYDGFDMPCLFTEKGLIHLQRKNKQPSHEEKERMEHKGMSKAEIAKHSSVLDKIITAEWEGANPHPTIETVDPSNGYTTYGLLHSKARAFKKIIYRDLYPGIDVIYSFTGNDKNGFEYTIKVNPGANLSLVRMAYKGDVKSIKKKNGILTIASAVNSIQETDVVSYYDQPDSKTDVQLNLKDHVISFTLPENYDSKKTLFIDPFVTNTLNLLGLNIGKAKDVDFDFAGNVYVSGGGTDYNSNNYLAKYDANGNLLWTFEGTLSLPSWNFGSHYGGWVVEKPTGLCYLGQGFNWLEGFQIVRLSTDGIYDGFISTANPAFNEDWKMIWNCNGGEPQILSTGGSTSGAINLGVVSPPTPTVASVNLTGITGSFYQDIADVVVDPKTYELYCIFASLGGTPEVNDRLYKIKQPYSYSNVVWWKKYENSILRESDNRPYLGFGVDNSINALAINSSYLFYWDGKNLQAIDKATGNPVGQLLTIAGNSPLWQGGIIADECNNIFVGTTNGTIKVYKFDGTSFDDDAAPDLTIPGFPASSVYDLAFDNGNHLIYASGDGFLSALDVSGYCSSTVYTISVTSDCSTLSATATVTPAPSNGSIITYSLYNGTTLVKSNSTGVFTNLEIGKPYTVTSIIDLGCSGVQGVGNFTITGPQLNAVTTSAGCNNRSGSMTLTGTGTTAPYLYSMDGINFQTRNTYSGLSSDIYFITVKDSKGCINKIPVTIPGGLPGLQTTKVDAKCEASDGSITATETSGIAPFRYSIDGVRFSANNIFNNLAPGDYKITVKDGTNCTGTSFVTITTTSVPVLNLTVRDAFCNTDNGILQVTVSSGLSPYQFSLDTGNTYQKIGTFSNLGPGNYSIQVKDKNGCVATQPVVIQRVSSPIIKTNINKASCSNNDGVLTINATGGTPPLQYSLNGGPIQAENVFKGLSTGTYLLTVKDVNGCGSFANPIIELNNSVVIDAGTDKIICEGTKVNMTASSNAASIAWYPVNNLSSPSQLNTAASPSVTTKYYVTATTGICVLNDSVVVNVNPAPIADAGLDTVICFGNTIKLNGTGGTGFSWSPSTYLDNPKLASPTVFKPYTTIKYHLMVTDSKGCTSLQSSAVSVTVTPRTQLFVGNDTVIALGEPLPLTAIDVNNSGFNQYSWSPDYSLSDAHIINPVAMPDRDVVYTVDAKTPYGCEGKGTIKVKVFNGPEIYVPNAFTPNGDGLNDVVKAFPVGMKQFNYFTIFNRWGEKVFTTSDASVGWDGKINGHFQGTSVFIWIAEAVDYKGKLIQKKGTVTMIR